MITKILKDLKIDDCPTRISLINMERWWILQQLFAYEEPFCEAFRSDTEIEYLLEFEKGEVYQLEINLKEIINSIEIPEKTKRHFSMHGDLWVPLGMLSWHPMVSEAHPVEFKGKVAYISDAITFRTYQNQGVMSSLFKYTLDRMKELGFERVYLRTSTECNMFSLAPKMGFELIPDVSQTVESLRVGGNMGKDVRIFFTRSLR